MTPLEISRARRDRDANARAELETATARLCNTVVALADQHGLPAAMRAVEAARAELVNRRPLAAGEAGWLR